MKLFSSCPCLVGASDRNVWNDVLAKKHPDDIGSSAECSSDDEDLEECETNNPGGLG